MTALKAGHFCDFYREVAVVTRPCAGHICGLLLGRRYAQVAVMPADLRCIAASSRRSHGRRYDGYTRCALSGASLPLSCTSTAQSHKCFKLTHIRPEQ